MEKEFKHDPENYHKMSIEKKLLEILVELDYDKITSKEAQRQILLLFVGSVSLPSDIRDEMDADMEESGMAQGEIESCLNHWDNKYIIQRKEWFSFEYRVSDMEKIDQILESLYDRVIEPMEAKEQLWIRLRAVALNTAH